MTGGGSLIRMGCHPLSAVLYLKQVEAKARGETIDVASVTCDVGNVTALLKPEERTYIKANPVDVEDWGTLTATFSDGTKATVFSGDMIMGGVRNLIETYTSGGSLFANITPNTHLTSYQTSEEKLANVYITEKVDRKTGWQYICLEEEWTRGYLQEIQDFMECVATGRQPLAEQRQLDRTRLADQPRQQPGRTAIRHQADAAERLQEIGRARAQDQIAHQCKTHPGAGGRSVHRRHDRTVQLTQSAQERMERGLQDRKSVV